MTVKSLHPAQALSQYFLPRGGDVYPRLLLAVSVIAGVAHGMFIFVFEAAGVPSLALANVASLMCYVLAALYARKGRLARSQLLMTAEIIAHGVVATHTIGWASGFHHYIVLIIPVAIVSTALGARVKVVSALLLGVGYVLLDVAYRGRMPSTPLSPEMTQGLHHFNQASTLLILALLATVYFRLVQAAEARLQELASTDPLTQLRNRRHVLDMARREAAVTQRAGRPLAVVMGDVDHFKRINDHHGHAQGDAALRAVARVLRDGVREVDHVARWGGEEFLVLLPATDAEEARRVSERLREGVMAQAGQHVGEGVTLTMTLGVAVLQPGETVEQALQRADTALYEGKQAGRNRVIVAAHA